MTDMYNIDDIKKEIESELSGSNTAAKQGIDTTDYASMDIDALMRETQQEVEKAMQEIDNISTEAIQKEIDAEMLSLGVEPGGEAERGFWGKTVDVAGAGMKALGMDRIFEENKEKPDLKAAVKGQFEDLGKVFDVVSTKAAEMLAFKEYLNEAGINKPSTLGGGIIGEEGQLLSPEDARAKTEEYMLAKEAFFKSPIGAKLRAERVKAGKLLFDDKRKRVFHYGVFQKFMQDEDLKALLGTNNKEIEVLKDTEFAGEVVGTLSKWWAAGKLAGKAGNVIPVNKAAPILGKLQTMIKSATQTGTFFTVEKTLDADSSIEEIRSAGLSGAALGAAMPAAGYGIKGGAQLIKKIGTDPVRKYITTPLADKAKIQAYNTIKAGQKALFKAGDKLTKGQLTKIKKRNAELAWKSSEANSKAHFETYNEIMKPFMDKNNPIRLKAKYYNKDGGIKAKYLDDFGNFDITKTGLKGANEKAVAAEIADLILVKNTKAIQNITDLNTNVYNVLVKNGAFKSADGLMTGTAVQNMAKNLYKDGIKNLNKLGYDKPAARTRLVGVLKGTIKPTAAEKKALKPIRTAMKLHSKVYKSITGKTSESNYYSRMAKQEIYDAVETGKMLNLADDALKKHVDDAVGANIDKRIINAIAGVKKPEDVKAFIKAGTRIPKFLRKRNLPEEAWKTAQETDPYKVLNNMLIKQLPQMQNRNIAKGMKSAITKMETNGFNFNSANKLWLNQVANKYDPKYGAVAGLRKWWSGWVGRQALSPEWKQILRDMKDPLSYSMDKALTINAIGGLAMKPAYIAKNMTQPYQGLMIGRPMLTTINSQRRAVQLFGKSWIVKDMSKYTPDEQWALKTMGYLRGDSLATGAGLDKSGKFVKNVLFANVTGSDRANVFTSLIGNRQWALKMGMSAKRASNFAKVTTALEQHLYQSSTRSVIGSNFATKPVAQFTGWGFDTMDFALHGSNLLKQRFPEYAAYMAGRHPLGELAKYVVVQNAAVGILGEATGYNLDSARPQNIAKSTYIDTPLSWLNTTAGLFPMGQEWSNTGNIERMFGSLERLIPEYFKD